jgi:hypothetical protein
MQALCGKCLWCGAIMSCPSCGSVQRVQFDSKIAIHLPFSVDIAQAHVFLSVEISVCVECGRARFVMPRREVRELAIRMREDAGTS